MADNRKGDDIAKSLENLAHAAKPPPAPAARPAPAPAAKPPAAIPPPLPSASASPPPANRDESAEELYTLSPELPPPPKYIERPPTTKGDVWAPPAAQPPAAPNQPAARPKPSAAPTDEAKYHCLSCGYRLNAFSDFRCSECGRQHDAATLERWFDGDEPRRFESASWCIGAVIVLMAFGIVPENSFICFSRGASALVAGAACFIAVQGRTEAIGGYFAYAGALAAFFMMFTSSPSLALAHYSAAIVIAALLTLSMLSDPEGARIWQRRTRNTALGILLAAPVLAAMGAVLSMAFVAAFDGKIPEIFLTTYAPFRVILPFLGALAAWGWLWWTIYTVRRTWFPDDDAELGQS